MNAVPRAVRATATLFLVDGMTFGTWAGLIPAFQHRFDLSEGRLSVVLAGIVVGAMVSMPLTGRAIARWQSRRLLGLAGFLFPLMLVLLALAPTFWSLIMAAVVFGAAKGMTDVSVNAQGITVENASTRPIFASFQACWSCGGLVAAFLLTLALSRGLSPPVLLYAMSALLLLIATTTIGRLLPDPPHATGGDVAREGFAWPSATMLRLGAFAFLALFSEGVLLDWSAVYARTVTHMSVAKAPVAFAVFSMSMAGGRFCGDWLIARVGPANTLRLCGGLMAAGMALAVAFRTTPTVLAGFAIIGFGTANLVPVVFAAAARAHHRGPGPGVATATTIGYAGFLSGPPIIGALAAWSGLSAAFCVVILFGLLIATVGARVIGGAPAPMPRPAAIGPPT